MALFKDSQDLFNRQQPVVELAKCCEKRNAILTASVRDLPLLRLTQSPPILFPVGRMDKAWFISAIERSRFGSQRQLAPFLKNRNGDSVTPSNFSRMLSGERAMLLHEAQQLAKLLDQPLTEILVHAGVKMNERAMAPEEFARRLRSAGRGKSAGLVADLLRSLGYGDGADVLEQDKAKRAKAG